MPEILLELDEELNTKLKQFALDKYGPTRATQQLVIKDALRAYFDQQTGKKEQTANEVVNTVVASTVQAPVTRKRKAKAKTTFQNF